MKRLGRFGHCLSLIVGACLGTFAFLVLAVLVSAKPIREAVLSAHGILVSSKPLDLTAEQGATIAGLLEKGALISSNDLLTNVSSFYSTMIQVLIATFFVFGALSYFAIQANARRQIEELSETGVARSTTSHFNSIGFDRDLKNKIDQSLQIEIEDYEGRLEELEQTADRVAELEKRVHELINIVQPADPQDE
jgi:hypothetical protein